MTVAPICDCHGVDRATLRQAFERGARTPNALRRATRAGTGCGACRPRLRALARRWRLARWLPWVAP